MASILGFLLATAAAAAAALIVFPSPSKTLALAAILAGEKSLVIVAAAVLAAVLALVGSRPGTRGLATLTVLLSLAALVVALIPPAQALRLASEKRVDLDLGRYLRSKIDTEGPVTSPKTVTYNTVDGRALGLDVYPARASSNGPSPAVIVSHGGGWSAGEKGDASLFSAFLADHGYTVFDVQYRLAPQPNWKSATGDLKCAVGWVKQHAATPDWNIDPARLTLLGRSAGAHLSLLVGYTPGDPKLPPSCDAPDTTVESIVSYYGPTDLAAGYASPANLGVYDSRAREVGFIGGAPDTAADLYRLLSPTERVTAGAPRTLLIHGGRDQFVGLHNSEVMADKLHDAGVRYETLYIPYAQHSFDFVFGGFSEQIAEQVVLRFLADRPKAEAPAINDLPEERVKPTTDASAPTDAN
ncbi:MAG TPA: alpha/beta hydrolase [Polyangia bacterium]